MNTSDLKEQIKKLPANPGIYIFKNLKNKPLYIGKALNLKNRLKSYLKTESPRLQQMILETNKIDFTKTDSEIEALILESQYIKRYGPDFNIMLRDDKQYGFVGFTQEKFPKIFITHQPIKNENFIGPFTDIGALKITLRLLRRIFPYCTCKQTHHNYCLNYHIGKCMGDCCLKKDVSSMKYYVLRDYRKNIKAIKEILNGKKPPLIKRLGKEMKSLANKHEFEKALELQKKIEKLRKIFLNARIIHNTKYTMYDSETEKYNTGLLKQLAKILGMNRLPQRIEAYDIANIQGKHAVGAMIVFTNSKPSKTEYRKFKIYTKNSPDDNTMLKEVLTRRFNHPEWPMPDLVLVDGGRAQFNTAKGVVVNIPIIALTKNEKHIGHKIILKNNRELSLSRLPANIKNILLRLNSEAHRFAVSYYRKIHQENLKFKI